MLMFIQNLQYKLHKLNTAQIITLSFAGVIFVGGLILWLPFCTAAGQTTSFSDAMFTATTCVCVTGLVTVTTATHWSLIGKLVILLLIQIGGIGLIALASVIFISCPASFSCFCLIASCSALSFTPFSFRNVKRGFSG